MILPPPTDLAAFLRGEEVTVRVRMEPQPGRVECGPGGEFWDSTTGGCLPPNPFGPPGTQHGVGEEWFDDWEHNRVFYKADADDEGRIPYEMSGAGGFGGGIGGARILHHEWQKAESLPERFVRHWATIVTPEPPERDADGWWWVAKIKKENSDG